MISQRQLVCGKPLPRPIFRWGRKGRRWAWRRSCWTCLRWTTIPARIPTRSTTLEPTQGQIDGCLSQLPFKCYFPGAASVGDRLKMCPWVVSRVQPVVLDVPPLDNDPRTQGEEVVGITLHHHTLSHRHIPSHYHTLSHTLTLAHTITLSRHRVGYFAARRRSPHVHRRGHLPGGNPGANLKSISHRCYLREVAFEWKLTKDTIHMPLRCLQGQA